MLSLSLIQGIAFEVLYLLLYHRRLLKYYLGSGKDNESSLFYKI